MLGLCYGRVFVEDFVLGVLADILGHDMLHLSHRSHIVVTGSDVVQLFYLALGVLIFIAAHLGDTYLLVE